MKALQIKREESEDLLLSNQGEQHPLKKQKDTKWMQRGFWSKIGN